MTGGFTSSKALTAMIVTIVTATAALAAASGLPLSKQLTDAIIRLVELGVPVAFAVFGLLHHGHAKIAAAHIAAHAPPSRSAATRTHAPKK